MAKTPQKLEFCYLRERWIPQLWREKRQSSLFLLSAAFVFTTNGTVPAHMGEGGPPVLQRWCVSSYVGLP
jgi:hypothetical protein